jgi:transcriptional regulator GlxA family with amidase domain
VAETTLFERFAPRRRKAHQAHQVAVLAFDGVVLADLATPCELFGRVKDARGRAGYEVRVCSGAAEVRSQHVALKVPWRLAVARRAETLVVPGIDDVDRPIDAAVLRVIREALARGARVASICSGAFVLAAAGVLDGRRATTHWMAAPELRRRYPRVTVDAEVLYVDNGRVLTSAGAAAGLDLCLHLVRRDFGAEVAASVARAAVMPLHREGGQAQFIVHAPPPPEGTSMGMLLEWIELHLRDPLPLPVLARRAAMSTRSLARRFRAEVGATPAAWIAGARVRRAQRLLETTELSIERLALEVGFGSPTVLRTRFRELVGTSPQSYRRQFSSAGASLPLIKGRRRSGSAAAAGTGSGR